MSFDNFLVVGDVETLAFDRRSAIAEQGVAAETWTRTGTTAIEGSLVSIFNPTWTHAEVWDSIRRDRRGWDRPGSAFGTLRVPEGGDGDVATFGIRLNVSPLNVPESRVERIDDSAQYASHVVNFVAPDFGNSRTERGRIERRERQEVARRFYEHFPDAYEQISVLTAEIHVDRYGADHGSVRNPIAGLGIDEFDESADFGSGGVLRAVEMYQKNEWFTHTNVVNHEIGHQWVDYWDWSELAGGVEAAGHAPEIHTPLLSPGGVLLGAVLGPARRVATVGDTDEFVIEHTPAPARYQPTTLYRAGLIGPESVPEILVFEDQAQFAETRFDASRSATPDVGTPVEGGYRRVHINDILARHGTRSGPVDHTWRLATVIVSRDELLSPEEMSFWNFYAARHAATEGVSGFDHAVGSFFEATGGRSRLHSDLTPNNATRIVDDPPLQVSYMPIAPGEFHGVLLDDPVPDLIGAGERIEISGAVTRTERDDFDRACVRWRRAGDVDTNRIFECRPVTGNRFSVPYTFTADDAGQYQLASTCSGRIPVVSQPVRG